MATLISAFVQESNSLEGMHGSADAIAVELHLNLGSAGCGDSGLAFMGGFNKQLGLFNTPALDLVVESRAPDNSVFKYRSGDDLTIACYNFSLRDGAGLAERLSAAGVESDLFHVNYVPDMDAGFLLESCARTGTLVLIDDSKSVAKFGDRLVTEFHARRMDVNVLPLGRRGCDAAGYGVAEDRFLPDYDAVLTFASRA